MTERRNSDRRQESRREPAERRTQRRVPVAIETRFLRSGIDIDEVVVAEILDVSADGLRIETAEPLIRGETLLVEIRDREDHCCSLSAEVVWVDEAAAGAQQVGCELRVKLTRRQFSLLRLLLPASP